MRPLKRSKSVTFNVSIWLTRVNVHGGGQSRIVHLNTQHLVLDDDPAPLTINGFTIW